MVKKLSQMGMDGFFFARIDYDDRNTRLKDKTMEMVWQSSGSLGAAADIFTGILYYGYGPPPGFCFDVRCDSSIPIQVCVYVTPVFTLLLNTCHETPLSVLTFNLLIHSFLMM